MTEKKVLGTLSFGTRTRTRFTHEELSLMKAVADHVAIAIEREKTASALEVARSAAVMDKNRLQAVIAALPVGVLITDNQGGNIAVNRAFEKIWGGPRLTPQTVSDYAAFEALVGRHGPTRAAGRMGLGRWCCTAVKP